MADKRHETAKRTRLTEEQDAANLCNALRKNMFRPSRNSALSREGSLYPSAVRTLFPRNSELDPYAFVSILLNESVLSILAAGINSSFAKKKKREKARVRELRDTNSDEVFRFILEYFRQNTSWGKQGMPEGDLMAQYRFKRINSALRFTSASFKTLSLLLLEANKSILDLGNFITIDETMVGYRGAEALKKGASVLMPCKPAKVGVLIYQASSRLVQSNKSVIVAFLVRLAGKGALSPQLSMLRLVDMINEPIHVFADSAFLPKTTPQMVPPNKATFSISVGEASQSGLLPVVRFLKDGLLPGHSRTALVNGFVIQAHIAKNNAQHINIIATNAWNEQLIQKEVLVDYDTAAKLLAFDLRELRQLHRHIDAPLSITKAKFIEMITGHDPEHPPQMVGQLDLKDLLKMKTKQLRAIAQNTPGAIWQGKVTKKAMAESIIRAKRNPLEAEISPLEELRTFDVDLETDAHVVTEYNQHYGLIDHADRELSTKICLRNHKHESGVVTAAILFFAIHNAYNYYYETALRDEQSSPLTSYKEWLQKLITSKSNAE